MYRFTLLLCILASTPAIPLLYAQDANQPVPSYQADLAAFQAERAKAPGPALDSQDRKIMQDAADRLALAMPDPGLKVGERAPDFSLPNAFGKTVRLYDLLENGPVVVTFYRGAWCPYCNLQLRGLHGALPQFERYGAQLVAITPQVPDKSREQVEKDGYPFEVLSDLDNRVMQAYRLLYEVPPELSELYKTKFSLDLADYNGAGRYILPVPGTYVIDGAGIIKSAFADVDYRVRIEPAEILATLARLANEH